MDAAAFVVSKSMTRREQTALESTGCSYLKKFPKILRNVIALCGGLRAAFTFTF